MPDGATRPWDADVDLAPDLACRLIRDQFPELGDGDLHLLGAGWDNTAYRYAGRWVFRFPRRAIAAQLLEAEQRVLTTVAGRLPLQVPAPLPPGRPALGYPYPFMGYALLPGRSACSLPLDDAARQRAAGPLGAFLAALHATPAPADLNRIVSPVVLAKTDLPKRAADAHTRLAALERIGAVDATRLSRALTRLAATPPWQDAPVLVHGDLYACHVLLDERLAITAVIDWGDTHAGDPALDLSIAYSFLPAAPRETLLDAYGDVHRDTLDRARFRALCYGIQLLHYGINANRPALSAAGRYALRAALDGG